MNKTTTLVCLFFITLLALLLIHFYCFENFETINETSNKNNIELLVARYNENLEWLKDDIL
jgi:hypothetical protein